MRTDTVEEHLVELAGVGPARGAGTGAALHAAQGAALVAGAARRSVPRTAADTDVLARAVEAADRLRDRALDLGGEDTRVVADLTTAHRLPRTTDAERAARAASLATATAAAARVPARVVALTGRTLSLAETVRPVASRGVLPTVAAAAEALRAAAGTARVLVEVNLVGLAEPAVREELLAAIDDVDDLVLRAAKVTAAVRERMLR